MGDSCIAVPGVFSCSLLLVLTYAGHIAGVLPSHDRTAGKLAAKYEYAITRDALTNAFREFWPDIATHVLHRH